MTRSPGPTDLIFNYVMKLHHVQAPLQALKDCNFPLNRLKVAVALGIAEFFGIKDLWDALACVLHACLPTDDCPDSPVPSAAQHLYDKYIVTPLHSLSCLQPLIAHI